MHAPYEGCRLHLAAAIEYSMFCFPFRFSLIHLSRNTHLVPRFHTICFQCFPDRKSWRVVFGLLDWCCYRAFCVVFYLKFIVSGDYQRILSVAIFCSLRHLRHFVRSNWISTVLIPFITIASFLYGCRFFADYFD